MKGALDLPPILAGKRHDEPSVFTPESLLREARRQRGMPDAKVPAICVLDPDGDIARYLQRQASSHVDPNWVCYHTSLHRVPHQGVELGVVPCAVGASFAVLVAEELFASGCELLISVTSAGQLAPLSAPPYFVLIDKALRDEGTSYHYLPPSNFVDADPDLTGALAGVELSTGTPIHRGAVWTTDAPFRETESQIQDMRDQGLLAVEMEAAALYSFAQARDRKVLCFAHVTNQMGTTACDFEKGLADGAIEALELVAAAAKRIVGAI